ncbi:GOLPH3/VPS74 family protein [Pseudonocardia alaniniphila]|uniref:GPP34 family phosphoprotein n=1 Tax=Pseudonocardia alaniniphila TaxID=75291 RepID=A0ABS9TVU6_9PSEU|nr:GPP34 family phosphoprotein [Pseudonocardia alaniniphila]MCH6172356.1 GPP34 family phosphoprotein [Pseudonocardia alaniniphila]
MRASRKTESHGVPRATAHGDVQAVQIGTPSPSPTTVSVAPLLAEDLMLLLFSPSSGTIAGEGTLFYVLGGALLAELAQLGLVETEEAGLRGTLVRTAGDAPPGDVLLRSAWDYVAEKPRNVQTFLAAVGPPLRKPVLDRLVKRGDVARSTGRTLGLFTSTRLGAGTTDRRADLVERVRAVLEDGVPPDPRTAALVALLSASGSLPMLHREIPWTAPVIDRATALEQGDWGAGAAASAVTRTTTAIVVSALVAAAVLPGS